MFSSQTSIASSQTGCGALVQTDQRIFLKNNSHVLKMTKGKFIAFSVQSKKLSNFLSFVGKIGDN